MEAAYIVLGAFAIAALMLVIENYFRNEEID